MSVFVFGLLSAFWLGVFSTFLTFSILSMRHRKRELDRLKRYSDILDNAQRLLDEAKEMHSDNADWWKDQR